MKSRDEIQKLKAVTIYVAQNFIDGVDYIKLFKILYFAQQSHLASYGRGIISDTFHALRYGPVPAFIYKGFQMLEGRQEENPDFSEFCQGFNIKDKKVISVQSCDMDELSKSDILCLNDALKNYGHLPSERLSQLSHDAAWTQASNRAQDDPEKDRMSQIEIARAGGASEDMINYIRQNLILDQLLS